MGTPTLADFLQRMLVWPDPSTPQGWVNLHWRRPGQKGITGSQACKTIEEVLGFTRWSMGKGRSHIGDLYYCTSLQNEHGEVKPNGRFAAERSIDNAISSRLLFADVDKYPSKAEAAAAIKFFCDTSGSPYPTALVDSGGGLHAYWSLPEPLARGPWLELASKHDGLMNQYGLKHDNISTDMARILRLPETFNYKRGEPQPVVLKLLNGHIDLEAWKSLHLATPTSAVLKTTHKSQFALAPIETLFVDPRLAEEGPASIFAQRIPIEERFLAGNLDPAPILKFCPMFGSAIATGGKEVGQPVWHQQALAATFLSGGRDLFHDLGCKHPTYSRQDSDDMFDHKLRIRLTKGLGYPSCAAFEADGCQECKTCPLKGKVTSPLNITDKLLLGDAKIEGPPVVVEEDSPPPPDGCISLEHYKPFYYESDGSTWHKSGKTKKKVILSKIYACQPMKAAKGEGGGMLVVCQNSLTRRVEINIPSEAFTNGRLLQILDNGGCMTMGNLSLTTELMCSIRGRLHLADEAQRAQPFGWVLKEREEGGEDQSEPIGFSYGGKVYYADGHTNDAYGSDDDKELREIYCVTGTSAPWFEALKVILDTKSAGLQCLTLASFAAPLMYLTGHYGTAFMAMGESGGSKSSAAVVGVAAWAKHKSAMLKPTTSNLAMMKRMGKVRHLVTVWDDIQREFFDGLKPTLIQVTQGSEGLKLDQQRRERAEGEWESMVVTTSNDSLAEYLEEHTKNNSSALVRCFEIQLPEIKKGDLGYVDNDKMAPLFASLNSNHGHLGREYSKMLGGDPAGIKALLETTGKRLKDQIEPYEIKERYWLATAQTLLTAAHLANLVLTLVNKSPYPELQFDVDALEVYLVATFKAMRARTDAAKVNPNSPQYAKAYLSGFINDYAAIKEQMLWSQEMPMGRGRPSEGCAPIWPIGLALQRMKRVTVRWLTSKRVVRISKPAFDTYLRDRKASPEQVLLGLKKFYGARTQEKVTLAGGVPDVAGGMAPETVIEIDVHLDSWLAENLDRHSKADDRQQIALPPQRQTPDPPATHHPLGHTGPAGD